LTLVRKSQLGLTGFELATFARVGRFPRDFPSTSNCRRRSPRHANQRSLLGKKHSNAMPLKLGVNIDHVATLPRSAPSRSPAR
jgi:hypothetical protein